MSIDKTWIKLSTNDELIDNLKIALREAQVSSNENLIKLWLEDAKAIKIELKSRGFNWLAVIKKAA